MSKDIPTVGASGGSASVIDIAFADGSKIAMAKDFAEKIDTEFDRLDLSYNGGTERYAAGSLDYSRVSNLISTLDEAAISSFQGTNTGKLDTKAVDYLQDVSWLLSKEQRVAEDKGAGDMSRISSIARGFSDALAPFQPPPPAAKDSAAKDGATQTGPTAAARSTAAATKAAQKASSAAREEVGDVKSLLADAKSSNNSATKSSKLSEAIASLIAAIRNIGQPAAETPADALKGQIDDLVEKIGGTATGGGAVGGPEGVGKPVEVPGGTAPGAAEAPPKAPEPKTYSGDELMGLLQGTSGGKPGAPLTFESEDRGIGIKDDEVGGGETLTFRAPERAEKGSVDLVDLFGDNGKEQEVAGIKVFDGDKLVKEIEVRGDADGDRTVAIDVPFDRLELTGIGNGSDVALKSVTLGGAAEAGGAEATAANAAATTASAAASDAEFEFDVTKLLELLSALSDATGLADGSKDLSSEQKAEMLDKIGGVVGRIADAIDGEGEGGQAITRDELVGILETTETLNIGIEGGIEDSGDKNAVMDALGDGLMTVFSAVDGGDAGAEEPETAIA